MEHFNTDSYTTSIGNTPINTELLNSSDESTNNESKNLSILHLVLYSDSDAFNNMYELTRKLYKKNKNVKTIYYKFSENIIENYQLENDILNIKGKETFVPGILDKTIKAFQYFENELQNYDYIVRSNISTIINFNLFTQELIKKPVNYSGGNIMTFGWTDIEGGLPDNTWHGTKFASGTAIIFSRQALLELIKNVDLIHKDIIDDIAIAIFFRQYLPNFIDDFSNGSKYIFVPNLNGNYENINFNELIFYRNRNEDRNLDCIQMKNIIKSIEIRQGIYEDDQS